MERFVTRKKGAKAKGGEEEGEEKNEQAVVASSSSSASTSTAMPTQPADEKPKRKETKVKKKKMKDRVAPRLNEVKHEELMGLVARHTKKADEYGCLILAVKANSRFSRNKKDYVQIKVKSSKSDTSGTNDKIQLHQLVAWNHSDPTERERYRASITDPGCKLEISHRCHRKDCGNEAHLHLESSAENKQRNGCPVVILINGKLRSCCKHIPFCLPNPEAVKTAPQFQVTCEKCSTELAAANACDP
jgi:hypothetical protein